MKIIKFKNFKTKNNKNKRLGNFFYKLVTISYAGGRIYSLKQRFRKQILQ